MKRFSDDPKKNGAAVAGEIQDDYTARANAHRPTDPAALAAEAVRLRRVHGLTAEDIAHCLRISVEAVRQMLVPGDICDI